MTTKLKNNVYSFEKARYRAALKKIEGQYHPDNREDGWISQDGYQIGMYDAWGFPIEDKRVRATPGSRISGWPSKLKKGVSVGLWKFFKGKVTEKRGKDEE